MSAKFRKGDVVMFQGRCGLVVTKDFLPEAKKIRVAFGKNSDNLKKLKIGSPSHEYLDIELKDLESVQLELALAS